MYCFWMQLWTIIVMQNLTINSFYCVNELTILFNLNYQMHFIRILTVPLIGLIFIGSISIFYLGQYFYGRNSTYFLQNMHMKQTSSTVMMIRYSLKVLVESAMHVILVNNSHLLLAFLTISSLITLIFLFWSEFYLHIYKKKGLFVFDCLC